MHWTIRNVEKLECRKLAQKGLVLPQVRNEGGQTLKARIHVGKGDHRRSRTEKHWESIHEIAERWLALGPTHVNLHRKVLLCDVQFVTEISDLFSFRFEVLIPLIRKDEIEPQKTCPDGLQAMPPAIAKILVANPGIELAGVQMVDTSIPPVFAHRAVAQSNELLGERVRAIAALGPSEVEKLTRQEIPRVRRYDIEKPCLGLGVPEGLKGLDLFLSNIHSERISA